MDHFWKCTLVVAFLLPVNRFSFVTFYSNVGDVTIIETIKVLIIRASTELVL